MNKIPSVHSHTKAINLTLGGIVLLFIGLLLFLPTRLHGPVTGNLTFPSGKAISIEVADDAVSRALGLSGRDSIGDDFGMLFTFSSPNIPRFWMKGMNFPLDIIWIREGVVIGIQSDVPVEEGIPTTFYYPEEDIDMVLEVRAGFSKEFGVSVGDVLDIQLPGK